MRFVDEIRKETERAREKEDLTSKILADCYFKETLKESIWQEARSGRSNITVSCINAMFGMDREGYSPCQANPAIFRERLNTLCIEAGFATQLQDTDRDLYITWE